MFRSPKKKTNKRPAHIKTERRIEHTDRETIGEKNVVAALQLVDEEVKKKMKQKFGSFTMTPENFMERYNEATDALKQITLTKDEKNMAIQWMHKRFGQELEDELQIRINEAYHKDGLQGVANFILKKSESIMEHYDFLFPIEKKNLLCRATIFSEIPKEKYSIANIENLSEKYFVPSNSTLYERYSRKMAIATSKLKDPNRIIRKQSEIIKQFKSELTKTLTDTLHTYVDKTHKSIKLGNLAKWIHYIVKPTITAYSFLPEKTRKTILINIIRTANSKDKDYLLWLKKNEPDIMKEVFGKK